MKPNPNQIKYDDMIIMVENSAALRVQNLGVTVEFDREKIKQIGSDRAIDYDGELSTGVTIDSNSWGCIDLLAQLTSRQHPATPVVNACEAQGGAVGIFDDAANTFTMKTFREAQNRRTDIIVPIREGDDFERSIYIPNQAITGMEYTYTVDGIATENYTLSGQGEYLQALGHYKDLRVARAAFNTANTCDMLDAGIALDLATPDHVVVGVSVNGEMFFKGTGKYAFAFATGTLTVTYQVGGAANIFATGDRITVLYVTLAAAGADWRETWADMMAATHPTPASPLLVDSLGLGKVDRGQVEIYHYTRNYPNANDLSGNAAAAVEMTRCQQFNLSVDLGGEPLNQLGQWIEYAKDFEDNVTVSVTILDSDVAQLAAMSGRTAAEITDYKDETKGYFLSNSAHADPLDAAIISAGDFFQAISSNPVDQGFIVKIYSDRKKTTLLKTITVANLELNANDVISTSVDGRNANTYGFEGDDFTIVGSGNSPF